MQADRTVHDLLATTANPSEPMTWNDTFNFPYVNERYLSVTIRAKDLHLDQKQYDYLIGAARIDLELFILNPAVCGPQLLQVSLK